MENIIFMKPMLYDGITRHELIAYGVYKHYEYYIMSFGSHPCIYIKLHENSKFYGKSYEEIPLDVHGGLSYTEDYLRIGQSEMLRDGWYIGWDYAHSSDYMKAPGMEEITRDGTRWHIEELVEEAIEAIAKLSIMDNSLDCYDPSKKFISMNDVLNMKDSTTVNEALNKAVSAGTNMVAQMIKNAKDYE